MGPALPGEIDGEVVNADSEKRAVGDRFPRDPPHVEAPGLESSEPGRPQNERRTGTFAGRRNGRETRADGTYDEGHDNTSESEGSKGAAAVVGKGSAATERA